jgi:hypothetical protein
LTATWPAGLIVPSLPGPLVDVMLHDSVGSSARVVTTLGLALTPLRALWGVPGSTIGDQLSKRSEDELDMMDRCSAWPVGRRLPAGSVRSSLY